MEDPTRNFTSSRGGSLQSPGMSPRRDVGTADDRTDGKDSLKPLLEKLIVKCDRGLAPVGLPVSSLEGPTGKQQQQKAAMPASSSSAKRPSLWKVRLCAKFMQSHCEAGPDCPFAHGIQELRRLEERESAFNLQGFVMPELPQLTSTQAMVQRNLQRWNVSGQPAPPLLDILSPRKSRHRVSTAPLGMDRDWVQLKESLKCGRARVPSLCWMGQQLDNRPRLKFDPVIPAANPAMKATWRDVQQVSKVEQDRIAPIVAKHELVERDVSQACYKSRQEFSQTLAPEDAGWHDIRHRIQTEHILANPHDVSFANTYILDSFSCGRTVESTIDDLISGRTSVGDIPKIRVVWRQGKLVTLDHRRLYAFRAALPLDAQVPMKLVLSDVLADQFLPPVCKRQKSVGVQKFSTPRGIA